MIRHTRRSALTLAAGAPIAIFGAGVANWVGATTGRAAGSLVDRFGVCGHLNDTGSAYHLWPKVKECLDFIGLRHIRTAAPQRGTIGYNLQANAARAGFKLTFTLRGGRALDAQIADLELFAHDFPNSIAAIEGPNEIDHAPVSFNGMRDSRADAKSHPAAALELQAALYAAVHGSTVLRSVPVIAFSDFVQSDQRADYSNAHIYPRNGSTLSAMLPSALKSFDVAKRPIMVTEVGFHTLPTATPFPGTDEATQARLIVDAVDALVRAKVSRSFFYELIDSYPANASMETHFGLFHYDYTPKPAALALKERLLRGI